MEYGEEEGNFDVIIVNDDLEIAYNEFKDTISKVKYLFCLFIV